MQSATVKSRWSLYQQYGLAAACHELAEHIATKVRAMAETDHRGRLRFMDEHLLTDLGFQRGDLFVGYTEAPRLRRFHAHEMD